MSSMISYSLSIIHEFGTSSHKLTGLYNSFFSRYLLPVYPLMARLDVRWKVSGPTGFDDVSKEIWVKSQLLLKGREMIECFPRYGSH